MTSVVNIKQVAVEEETKDVQTSQVGVDSEPQAVADITNNTKSEDSSKQTFTLKDVPSGVLFSAPFRVLFLWEKSDLVSVYAAVEKHYGLKLNISELQEERVEVGGRTAKFMYFELPSDDADGSLQRVYTITLREDPLRFSTNIFELVSVKKEPTILYVHPNAWAGGFRNERHEHSRRDTDGENYRRKLEIGKFHHFTPIVWHTAEGMDTAFKQHLLFNIHHEIWFFIYQKQIYQMKSIVSKHERRALLEQVGSRHQRGRDSRNGYSAREEDSSDSKDEVPAKKQVRDTKKVVSKGEKAIVNKEEDKPVAPTPKRQTAAEPRKDYRNAVSPQAPKTSAPRKSKKVVDEAPKIIKKREPVQEVAVVHILSKDKKPAPKKEVKKEVVKPVPPPKKEGDWIFPGDDSEPLYIPDQSHSDDFDDSPSVSPVQPQQKEVAAPVPQTVSQLFQPQLSSQPQMAPQPQYSPQQHMASQLYGNAYGQPQQVLAQPFPQIQIGQQLTPELLMYLINIRNPQVQQPVQQQIQQPMHQPMHQPLPQFTAEMAAGFLSLNQNK